MIQLGFYNCKNLISVKFQYKIVSFCQIVEFFAQKSSQLAE